MTDMTDSTYAAVECGERQKPEWNQGSNSSKELGGLCGVDPYGKDSYLLPNTHSPFFP